MKIAVLGATGSIGTQTLDVVRRCLPQDARVVALSGYSNVAVLVELAREFSPEVVWVPEGEAGRLREAGFSGEILTGERGLEACAAETGADVVVNALVGRAGLSPTLAALSAGKDIALANKETLVTAGGLVMAIAREKGVKVTPIDSEHSAIWQCLGDEKTVEKIILTASGGPFRGWSREKIVAARASDALRHPNWDMGAKITIDSATLMNKGLELIEAMWLFGDLLENPFDDIEIIVHPQSIIHSMVRFLDGSVIAQLGLPDMRLPIMYALTAPKRFMSDFPRLDFLTCGELTFEAVDRERFPCLELAHVAASAGGTLPAVMNYINEWAVGRYLRDEIGFYDISDIITAAFGTYTVRPVASICDIIEAEEWAAEFVKKRTM